MKYGSVCSGIEAASVAWEPLGWEAQWLSEIEDVPCSILAHRFPKVPNLGDMTKLHELEVFNGRPIELLVGGTPCQSFSIAGLRKGLADPRGNLALHFLKILDLKRPQWVVWENVCGVLSSWSDEAGSFKVDRERGYGDGPDGGDGGAGRFERGWQTNDFDTFTSGLRELGYGVAYRVLDAQFFGVAQRRRRVFVVGYLGDWRPAAAVLLERSGLSGNPAPKRRKPEGAPASLEDGLGDGGPTRPGLPEVAETLRSGSTNPASHGKLNGTDRMTLVPTVMAHGQANAEIREDGAPSLTCNHEAPIVAQTLYENHAQDSRIKESDVSPQINAKAGTGGGNLPLVAEAKEPTLLEDQGGSRMNVNDSGVAGTLRSQAHGHEPLVFESRVARNGRGAPTDVVPPLKAQSGEDGRGDGAPLVAYTTKLDNTQSNQSGKLYEDYAPRVSKAGAALLTSVSVRRLTPRECERLQGFPDDWTLVPMPQHTSKCDLYVDAENVVEGRPAEGASCTCGKPSKLVADGPRYKALGNSMAVPVMAWIGRRIQIVDDLLKINPKKKVKRG